jgi:hypothetical protein
LKIEIDGAGAPRKSGSEIDCKIRHGSFHVWSDRGMQQL